MPYNNIISRSAAQALIPEEVADGIIQSVVEESAVLSLFRRVTLSRNQVRIPVLSVLPTAYFVNGDTGIKQTTEQDWTNKYLNVEEVAAIVPIPENVLDDTSFDVWGEVKPRLVESIGRTIDAGVFFGINAPASWPTNIQAAATAAGNNVTEGTVAANGGFPNDVDNLIGAVEADGFDVSGFAASRTARAKFRQARTTTGARMASGEDTSSSVAPDLGSYLGAPIRYTMSGIWPTGGGAGTNVRLFGGDWSQFMVGVRKDITYKILDQAVLTDNTNAIQYNLAQQDMIALRVTMRLAWQVANPFTYSQPTAGSRYPAGVLLY